MDTLAEVIFVCWKGCSVFFWEIVKFAKLLVNMCVVSLTKEIAGISIFAAKSWKTNMCDVSLTKGIVGLAKLLTNRSTNKSFYVRFAEELRNCNLPRYLWFVDNRKKSKIYYSVGTVSKGTGGIAIFAGKNWKRNMCVV